MPFLKQWKCFFVKFRSDGKGSFRDQIIHTKLVFADNELQASGIATAIARHDGKVWQCPIDFDRVDVLLHELFTPAGIPVTNKDIERVQGLLQDTSRNSDYASPT